MISKNTRYEILSIYGWYEFEAVFCNKAVNKDAIEITTASGLRLTATLNHQVFFISGKEIQVGHLQIGDILRTKLGPDAIISIRFLRLIDTFAMASSQSSHIYANLIDVSTSD
jgi:hypothetical protein